MMISHYEHLIAEEGMTWGPKTALRGANERLIPILMTATVTGLGLLDGIHGERADGVDAQLIEIRVGDVFGYWGHFVTSSRDATLPNLRRWRPAWLNSDSRNVWTRSHATDCPVVRPPMQMMFM